MNVVGHPAYAIGLAMKILGDTINICIEFFLMLDRDCSFAAVGAEDYVEVGCSVTHVILTIIDGRLVLTR